MIGAKDSFRSGFIPCEGFDTTSICLVARFDYFEGLGWKGTLNIRSFFEGYALSGKKCAF
jgi:hypothetical protein